MHNAPKPERRFIEDLRRHPTWGIAFVLGVVVLAGYLIWHAVGWSGLLW